MTQLNLLELAKQGNPHAIAALINRQLKPKGINTTASLSQGCLQLVVHALTIPPKEYLMPWLEKSMTALAVPSIDRVNVETKNLETGITVWRAEFQLTGSGSSGGNFASPPSTLPPTTGTPKISSNQTENVFNTLPPEPPPPSKKIANQGKEHQPITNLLNLILQSKKIYASAGIDDEGCLQVILESEKIPDEEETSKLIRKNVSLLKIETIKTIKIEAFERWEDTPAWVREIDLQEPETPPAKKKAAKTSKPNAKTKEKTSDSKLKIPKNSPLLLWWSSLMARLSKKSK